MKLQDFPQPKVQYNHQIENNVAIINFWQLFAELLVIFLEIIENHTAKWLLLLQKS